MPASYLTTVEPLRQVKATYAFEASNSEELSVAEDEELLLFAHEEEWSLIGRLDSTGVGYMPTSYLDVRLSKTARCSQGLMAWAGSRKRGSSCRTSSRTRRRGASGESR